MMRRTAAAAAAAASAPAGAQAPTRLRPRRVLFNCPGSDQRKLAKLPSLGGLAASSSASDTGAAAAAGAAAAVAARQAADVLVLDLEDGVAPPLKAAARRRTAAALGADPGSFDDDAVDAAAAAAEAAVALPSSPLWAVPPTASSSAAGAAALPEWGVRTNAVESGLLAADVAGCVAPAAAAVHEAWKRRQLGGGGGGGEGGGTAAAAAAAGVGGPLAVVLPKVESGADVAELLSLLRRECGDDEVARSVPVLAAVESAKGFMNLADIAAAGKGQLAALIFASEDLAADIGLTRTPGAQEMLFYRASLVTAAVAHDLQAIDMVCLNFRQPDTVRAEALTGAQMGFTGKQAIHPAQIEPINDALLPDDDQADLARRIITGFDEAVARGLGAFELDGKMIDMPMVKWARRILARAGESV